MSTQLHKLPSESEAGAFASARRKPTVTLGLNGTVGSRSLDRRIQVVLIMLEESSHRKVAAREIARIVNLSAGRLAHLFKDEMGVSLQQYLTEIRLAKAKHQLDTGFLSIKEIAASVGFSSVNQFIDTFKTASGFTPAQYRKLSRNINPQRKDFAIARSANE